jgi:acetate kinase
MSILVINCGSSSLKYKIFDEQENELGQGLVSRPDSVEAALKIALREISDLAEIRAVGHRVVHGGDEFSGPVVVDDQILARLTEYNHLAPLHNPYNLLGIKIAREFLPDLPQLAVFDTAFYADLPEVAATFALPREFREKFKIKKYGFHGLSHNYAMLEAAKKLNKPAGKINLISCHLGGGWSVTAVKQGRPLDTSMGMTPLGGLVMMTRPGDLDPGVVIELIKGADALLTEDRCEEVYNLLNHQSGLKGLSGLDDYQKLLKEVSLGNRQAELAFKLAVYQLIKQIGAYWTVLAGRLDALVFTGAIGAGHPMTRQAVMAGLKHLAEIPLFAIKTDEELMIAREVNRVLTS